MVFYNINQLCPGFKIMYDSEPCVVVNNEFIKPGKGQSFNRVKFRTLITGKNLEKIFKSGDLVQSADIIEVSSVYLYSDATFWYFMNCENFDQIVVNFEVIGDNSKWLVEQVNYNIILWCERPISVIPPNFVCLKVTDTSPGIKGNSVTSVGTKLATLITGVTIRVPVFVQVGEIIKVDTRFSRYISRVK
ncbi:elongation factor P [Blochmannia endosymbiont of Colobopsis nipponica]|uniref:elongation factor P n=1 Tax=Blochmannia endosymbiont of Colobopsis nipponica TaxID=2681987 RepID=UPI00177FD3B8|nr:elongation factor P [Blochmannia endosymbiont of Colobopsis nipponica]QOI10781.1 elongation factor P [Blochmannia endosymbiont of Colobopsis nipponica]